MGIIAHTMEYQNGGVSSNLPVRNYADGDYEEYRRVYEACFVEPCDRGVTCGSEDPLRRAWGL